MSLPSNTNVAPTGEPGDDSPMTSEESQVRGLTPPGSPNVLRQEDRRSIVVDMPPAAIDQRLRQYVQLWNF
jgi:hypothetical protein